MYKRSVFAFGFLYPYPIPKSRDPKIAYKLGRFCRKRAQANARISLFALYDNYIQAKKIQLKFERVQLEKKQQELRIQQAVSKLQHVFFENDTQIKHRAFYHLKQNAEYHRSISLSYLTVQYKAENGILRAYLMKWISAKHNAELRQMSLENKLAHVMTRSFLFLMSRTLRAWVRRAKGRNGLRKLIFIGRSIILRPYMRVIAREARELADERKLLPIMEERLLSHSSPAAATARVLVCHIMGKSRLNVRVFEQWRRLLWIRRSQRHQADIFFSSLQFKLMRNVISIWRFMSDAAVVEKTVKKRNELMLLTSCLRIMREGSTIGLVRMGAAKKNYNLFIQHKIRRIFHTWIHAARIRMRKMSLWHGARDHYVGNLLRRYLLLWITKTRNQCIDKKMNQLARLQICYGIRKRYFWAWRGAAQLLKAERNAMVVMNMTRMLRILRNIIRIWKDSALVKHSHRAIAESIIFSRNSRTMSKVLNILWEKASILAETSHEIVHYHHENLRKKYLKLWHDDWVSVQYNRFLIIKHSFLKIKAACTLSLLKQRERTVSDHISARIMRNAFFSLCWKSKRISHVSNVCAHISDRIIAKSALSRWISKYRTVENVWRQYGKSMNELILKKHAWRMIRISQSACIVDRSHMLRILTHIIEQWRYQVRLGELQQTLFIASSVASLKRALIVWQSSCSARQDHRDLLEKQIISYSNTQLCFKVLSQWLKRTKTSLNDKIQNYKARVHYDQFLSKIGFKSLRMYNSVTKQMRKSARMNRMCSRFIAMHESMRNRREVSHAFHLWCSKIRTVVDRRREEELWKKSVKFHETQTKKHCFLAWRRYVAG
ncbi:hypothetical protein ADUPG1_013815, partial [Aduncisulcus paluster]